MRRIHATSVDIAQIGHQEDSETLEIQFSRGEICQYYNVPSGIHDELMKSPAREEYKNRRALSLHPHPLTIRAMSERAYVRLFCLLVGLSAATRTSTLSTSRRRSGRHDLACPHEECFAEVVASAYS